ncbi:hypothetical protein BLA24_20460 [Streptomyces cinnamoneus]|uniref:Uncharacterized protein n=1 Tax=Streptomyces cinnamoneus TaxID=53446 RepID=A0A2G1XFH1_STRCJ|nr:hypothetical protein [Streptomyces cinnamoneus]PHQ49990.1 hypothetical protein BLA24_20460 [Streptomyces cinnamoneus]PPT13233.1 hypothetical protein CYQ11_10325 [Streptomyces cinnamoneus]
MFDIRIICDSRDVDAITRRLSGAFDISAMSRPYPARGGDRVRLYITADHSQCVTVDRASAASVAQDWPDAETAYKGAPPVLKEMNNVLGLSLQLGRPGGRTPAAEREQRLRKAALLDRIALDEAATYAPDVAANAVEAAEAAALAFARADHEPGCGEQPMGHEGEASYRGYVRQAYARWRTGQ